jgi:Tol biopolymer transport system component
LAAVVAAASLVLATAGPAQATFPGANGRIAFVRPDHGGYDIFTSDPDGTEVSQLTTLAPHHSAFNPAWSPDGSQIVFERVNARGQHNHIWIMNADGSSLRRLFPDPWFTDHTPSFSPDGTKVLFSRCQNDPPPADQDRCTVATIDIDGTGMERLTVPSAEELAFWPTYSPDGTRIAFTVFYGRGVIGGVFVMDADGSAVHLVTPPKLGGWGSDWAPDGSRLVFTSHCCDRKSSAIWAVDPDGSGLARVTSPGERHDFLPVNAPDGTQIVFERDNADFSRFGLFTMKPDGTGITRILDKAFNAAWQPLGPG